MYKFIVWINSLFLFFDRKLSLNLDITDNKISALIELTLI